VSRVLPIFFLPFLLVLVSCGTDYPPIDPYISFNIDRSVDFTLLNTAGVNKDTTLIMTGKIDTMAYVKNGSSAYLLHTSEVLRLELQSNDPNFTLDQLGFARVLIGADTVAFDSIPMGTIDTSLTLTKTDVTKYMQDTSFTALLQCHLKSTPENPTTIVCSMTVVHTALSQ
jgi:hypothetical protein